MQRLSDRRIATFFALLLASGACCALVLVRMQQTGEIHYRFLVWNLFLAWIPFLVALVLYDGARRGLGGGPLLMLGAVWLVFLPNAPYIATDFIHVGRIGGAPLWFDALLVASFAGTGLLLGLASLLLVQSVVARATRPLWGWVAIVPLLAACSTGIVLGRVYRFNSWDVLSEPESILRLVADKAADPAAAIGGLMTVAALTGALGIAYLVLYALSGLADERDG